LDEVREVELLRQLPWQPTSPVPDPLLARAVLDEQLDHLDVVANDGLVQRKLPVLACCRDGGLGR